METAFHNAQRFDSVGTLAGGIAHDFNNLLMGIQGNASLVLIDFDKNHEHYENIKNIEYYIQQGVRLTKQLLGLASRDREEVKPVDINEIIQKSTEMFGRAKKEIRIHKKLQNNIQTLEVDQGQIEQVLLNLFVNAWQAMPSGGDLYVETQNSQLDDTYVEPYSLLPGKYVKLSVTDTGVGMDRKTQQHIFDPFYTTKEAGRGTGLGLASCYGIVKNHNGIINVYSEPGEGATFTIHLPVSEKAVSSAKPLQQQLLRGNENILLIDDEQMVVDVGRLLLEELGYSIVTAPSGKEGLQQFLNSQKKIDLVILDMIMPDMSGKETFKQLREQDPQIKVLLSSGYSLNKQAKEILSLGCNGFIQKPFNLVDLSILIRDILSA